jgi:5'-3' exonuclease
MILLLIDGDEIAWKAASSVDTEGECVDYIENYHAKLLSHIEANYDMAVTDFIYFVGGVNNFRKFLFPSYKKKRKKEYPELLNFASDFMVTEFNAFKSYGVETDDSICATYYEWLESPFFDVERDRVIIVGQDKDYRQIPCLLFDSYWNRYELVTITVEDANRFFMSQMLMGDTSDNVDGIRGIGKAKAKKILDGSQSWYGLLRRVYAKYLETYGVRNAKLRFMDNYRQLRLLREGIKTPSTTQKTGM